MVDFSGEATPGVAIGNTYAGYNGSVTAWTPSIFKPLNRHTYQFVFTYAQTGSTGNELWGLRIGADGDGGHNETHWSDQTIFYGHQPTVSVPFTSTVDVPGLPDDYPLWFVDLWGFHWANGTIDVTVEITDLSTHDPEASFTFDPPDGFVPLTVAFTDTSDPGTGGTITGWHWDFGDGSTSTAQNPSHTFNTAGTFDVVLTITVAAVDYTTDATIDVIVDVGYVPPPPGLALVEIKATSPGACRWDEANWDECEWSSDTWQNVTPESVEVSILWGSQRPELGILGTPDAQSWQIGLYDPDRILDPANPLSPYFGDLVPGLPVRITHNGWVVKTGVLESLSHNFDLNSFQAHHAGALRVTDSQSLMARSAVPEDVTLSDTLWERAADAIAAAGLAIGIVPHLHLPNPDLAPWVTGQKKSAWEWISDAALQSLQVPYIDRNGLLGFRSYEFPFQQGPKELGSPNLVSLGSVIYVNGTYSVIKALDEDAVTIVTRELTPKPYYGTTTYERTDPTHDSGTWAEKVLADRAVAGLRWVPGPLFPLNANDVRRFAEIGASGIERVSIDYPEATPGISATGKVVGGEINITAKKDSDAIWSFTFQVAATEDQPLVDDDDGFTFLVNDDDVSDYLYPG